VVKAKQHLYMCIFLNIMAALFISTGKLEAGCAFLFAGLCKFENYGITKRYEEDIRKPQQDGSRG
jgi:hypothetical protein